MKLYISGIAETTLEDRFFNISALIGAVTIFGAFIVNILADFPVMFNIFLFFSGCCCFFLYYLGRFKKKVYRIPLFIIALTVICFSWFYNEGIEGSTPFSFFIVTVVFIYMFKESRYFIILSLVTVIAASLILIQYIFPESITPYSSHEARLSDLSSAFISWLFTMGYAVIVFKRTLDAERNTIQKQKKQIEEQYKGLSELHYITIQQKEEILIQAEHLKSQNDKLLEMDEFKQGMTSMIVHDLKNPLNLILNIPKSIKPEKQIAAMQQSGKQMLNMVLNILDVHKYEENAMKLELEEKQFALISGNAVTQVKFLCEQKDIKINDEIEPGLVTKVEEEIIERVLVNLLTNAIKYTPVNGAITLSSNKISENIVKIEVSDTGEGIAENTIHLVFKKFGQIVAKNSGTVKSTGLGLTYCKMAVEAHGGEIGLNSEIGQGTTFWFTLQTGKAEHVNLKTVEKEREIEKDIITFSEDEKTILAPIIDRLKTFTIYETDDIEEILEEIKQNKAENIQKWIVQIEKNICTLNQTRFLELLKIYLK